MSACINPFKAITAYRKPAEHSKEISRLQSMTEHSPGCAEGILDGFKADLKKSLAVYDCENMSGFSCFHENHVGIMLILTISDMIQALIGVSASTDSSISPIICYIMSETLQKRLFPTSKSKFLRFSDMRKTHNPAKPSSYSPLSFKPCTTPI